MKYMTLTSQGQITIPIALRRKYNLQANTKLLVREEDDAIVIQPASETDELMGALKEYAMTGKSSAEIRALEEKAVEEAVLENFRKKQARENEELVDPQS